MPAYVQLAAEQIPVGTTALVLFVDHGHLCAGVIEHRCDGRLDRRVPDAPHPDDVIPIICELMSRKQDAPLHVVLETDAYWPEQFPLLQSKF